MKKTMNLIKSCLGILKIKIEDEYYGNNYKDVKTLLNNKIDELEQDVIKLQALIDLTKGKEDEYK